MRLVADLFLLLGALFLLLGALGLVRMPDVYNRIQAGTKSVTLGAVSFLLGVALLHPDWWANVVHCRLYSVHEPGGQLHHRADGLSCRSQALAGGRRLRRGASAAGRSPNDFDTGAIGMQANLVTWIALVISVLVLVSAVLVLTLRNMIGAVAVSGVVSLGVAVLFVLLHAPDVAMTEAAVGAGLSGVVLALGLRRLGLGRLEQDADAHPAQAPIRAQLETTAPRLGDTGDGRDA